MIINSLRLLSIFVFDQTLRCANSKKPWMNQFLQRNLEILQVNNGYRRKLQHQELFSGTS